MVKEMKNMKITNSVIIATIIGASIFSMVTFQPISTEASNNILPSATPSPRKIRKVPAPTPSPIRNHRLSQF